MASKFTVVPQSMVKVSLPPAGTVSECSFQSTSMGQQPSEITVRSYGPNSTGTVALAWIDGGSFQTQVIVATFSTGTVQWQFSISK